MSHGLIHSLPLAQFVGVIYIRLELTMQSYGTIHPLSGPKRPTAQGVRLYMDPTPTAAGFSLQSYTNKTAVPIYPGFGQADR